MQELAWVIALLMGVGALTATLLVPWPELIETGQTVMLGSSALGIPLEILYFALLALALRLNGNAPPGWYWRSFIHHDLLSATQRRWVLPWFYAGALAFLGIMLGIGVVLLGALAAWRQS